MARYTNPGAISSAGGASCIVCSLITVVYASALHLHFIRRTRTRVCKQAGRKVRLELRGVLKLGLQLPGCVGKRGNKYDPRYFVRNTLRWSTGNGLRADSTNILQHYLTRLAQ